ncbi:MAG: bile acid:sodium symporter family protein [bacterium]
MKAIIDLGLLFVIPLIMTAVGLAMAPRHFREMARQKRALFFSLIVQPVLLPLLGLILIRVASLPPQLSAGILLLAACPNGDIVNFYSWLARANVALAVTMTLMSLLLAVITMPIIIKANETTRLETSLRTQAIPIEEMTVIAASKPPERRTEAPSAISAIAVRERKLRANLSSKSEELISNRESQR